MLNIGIIGCGKIAQVRHLPEYEQNPGARIAGLYDLNQERAQTLAAQYGAKVYPSYEALLADPAIDAVSVCSANVSHAEITVAALEAGKVSCYVTDFPNPKSAQMKHAVTIPHLGASTEESEDNCARMAVEELMDFLENGNIRNSACDMGVCRCASRVTVMHLNIPNMIGQITGTLASGNVNITDMTNKSRDKVAYTMLDLETPADEITIRTLNAIKGVLRVRVIR